MNAPISTIVSTGSRASRYSTSTLRDAGRVVVRVTSRPKTLESKACTCSCALVAMVPSGSVSRTDGSGSPGRGGSIKVAWVLGAGDLAGGLIDHGVHTV